MYLPDPGSLRLVLVLILIVLGIILRFTLSSRIRGFGLNRAGGGNDEDLSIRVRKRLGALLLVWAGWLTTQMVLGVPESWLSAVWAPFLILVTAVMSYSARLYAARYLQNKHPEHSRSLMARAGWLWIILRECVPLGTILVSILLVREYFPAIPAEVPVNWDFGARQWVWIEREVALDILRHRTMMVYGALFGVEGIYLIVAWMRHRDRDIAARMLSRPHWFFYMFKVGWVLTMAGLNLGLVDKAWGGDSLVPFLLPGTFSLAILAFLVVRETRLPVTPER